MSATVAERVHRYAPRGAALAALKARHPEVLLSGPAGTGKSRAALEKLHMVCLRTPGVRALIVRKTQRSLASTALDTWRKFVVAEALALGVVDFYGGSAEEPPQYRYANGSRVFLGGMDNPTKIMSSEYDLIYVQEATELTITDWEALKTRLRNWRISFQQIIADCNPDAETHWLKQRANAGVVHILWSQHADNPMLFDDAGQVTERGAAYMAALDSLTGVRRLRLRDGLWAAAEGLVYERWNPAAHLIDRWELPPDWPRVWSIDFGYTNPFVCQCWATDPDGRLVLEWEVYHTRRLVEEHCESIARHVMVDPRRPDPKGAWQGRWVRPRPAAVICDHDAEGRATFSRHMGLSTKPAHKKVKDGIQAVDARMAPAGDGRPRLLIMRDAVLERDPELKLAGRPQCTEEEFPGYVWAPPAAGKPPKEEPVKEDDHGTDATRYRVADADLRGTPRIRMM